MKTLTILALALATSGCAKTDDTKKGPGSAVATAPTSSTRIEIAVTEKGFEPETVKVPASTPVTLVFDRKTDATCAKEVVIDVGDGNKIKKDLPLDKPVEVAVTFPKAGPLTYACGMDMVHGTFNVQ
jgi:plastocyanin domain-containing protein